MRLFDRSAAWEHLQDLLVSTVEPYETELTEVAGWSHKGWG